MFYWFFIFLIGFGLFLAVSNFLRELQYSKKSITDYAKSIKFDYLRDLDIETKARLADFKSLENIDLSTSWNAMEGTYHGFSWKIFNCSSIDSNDNASKSSQTIILARVSDMNFPRLLINFKYHWLRTSFEKNINTDGTSVEGEKLITSSLVRLFSKIKYPAVIEVYADGFVYYRKNRKIHPKNLEALLKEGSQFLGVLKDSFLGI